MNRHNFIIQSTKQNKKGPNLTAAISFARLIIGEITVVRFFVYVAAQFCGAFLGALLTWIIYLEAIKKDPAGFHSIATAGNLKFRFLI